MDNSAQINEPQTLIEAAIQEQVGERRIPWRTFALGTLALVGVVSTVVLTGYLLAPQTANALPAFARQTGQPCASCHTAFPELTPFGRRFKLGGYTLEGGNSDLQQHLAGMLLPSFTRTQKPQDAPPAPHTGVNNNSILQQASLFYGGRIAENVGAFVQVTFDGASRHVMLDNTDIRYADTFKIFGKETILGVTVNNNPTVQDVWNTTPAWGFPQVSSSLGPQFSPPSTFIEGAMAGRVAGTGAYAFWNDALYLELSGYQAMSSRFQTTLGQPDVASSSGLKTMAPYWRLAYEPTWGDHSLMIGTFGMAAQVFPMRINDYGTDRITDLGFDAQYQFSGEMNAFTVKAATIFERQSLNSSFAQGSSSNLINKLRSTKVSASWVYDHTYSLSAGIFDVAGSADTSLYAAGADPSSTMGIGRPNGRGLVFDVSYLPFSHGGPSVWPWFNSRIGVQYTQYLKLYGASANFDGIGHSASDNNTLYLYGWVAF